MSKEKKTATELLKEIDEDEKISKNKLQKRRVEVIEYGDGTYSLIGFAWNLPLKADEVKDAFESWLDGSLVNGVAVGDI